MANGKLFVIAKAIGNGGITPTGTVEITENGTYDVSQYASADVDVPGVVPTGTINITENGTVDVTDYATAQVNVPSEAPNLEERTVTANGTYTPGTGYDGFSKVIVNVGEGPRSPRCDQTVTFDWQEGDGIMTWTSTAEEQTA